MYTNLIFKTQHIVNANDYCEQTDSFANETGAEYETIGLFIDFNGRPFTKRINNAVDAIPYIDKSKFDAIVDRMLREYEARTSI